MTKSNGAGLDAAYTSEQFRPNGPRFRLVRFKDILLSTTPNYLVKALVPRTGLIVIWGPPKCGKSFWTSDLAMHVALGWEYRGHKVKRGVVVYLVLEGDAGFKARSEAWRRRHLSDKDDPPFYEIATRIDLIADHAQLIIDILAQLPPGVLPALVVVDTVNRSLAGSESSDEDMGKYIKAADAIRDAFTCAVAVVHHCGIEGSRPRGHTSLTGACDAQISVIRDAANNIVVTVEWMKDGPEGEIVVSRLDQVEVGLDDEGDPITSCVIEPVEGVAAKRAKGKTGQLSGAAKKTLQALHEVLDEFGEPPSSSQVPQSVPKTVTKAQWRQRAYLLGISDSDKPDSMEAAFRRAYNALLKAEQIGVWDEAVWST